MSDAALIQQAEATAVFAEIEPNQKERIILALKKAGHVVGYLGDGINDASALHAADVGISVSQAVDVAKEAADIILLKQDLGVLVRRRPRRPGDVCQHAQIRLHGHQRQLRQHVQHGGRSLFLPFLPLLPKQILLMNVLTDLPEMTIATDSVDRRAARHAPSLGYSLDPQFHARVWYAQFGVRLRDVWCLRLLLGADEATFRTGWFLESVISASLVVLVVRSRRPFWQSRPGAALRGRRLRS